MEQYREKYECWKTNAFFDEETRAELAALNDEKEIRERFYKDLEFGTGGLRGILGAGSNRMNKYNVRPKKEKKRKDKEITEENTEKVNKESDD